MPSARSHPIARELPVDLCLVGGHIADVRAGVLRRAAVAIAGPLIAAVGADEDLRARAQQVIDVGGQVIVPGYIEPHGHVLLTNPLEFARAVLPHGTTTAVLDTLPLITLVRPERLPDLLENLARLPVKLRWLIRLHPQSFWENDDRYSLEHLRSLWRLPSAAAVGEVTRWMDVLDGDPDLLAKIRAAREDGKRVEGHAAGASYDRLKALAEAGFTSCHEAVTAQEVADRLRAGLHAMLRHSSIRPDLPTLAAAVTPETVMAAKVMLTADGPTPAFVADWGYLDHLIAVAAQSGIPPMHALRMATLNPALYYGWDALGEIAPGKRADLNVIRDLADPRPTLVVADGRVVARDGMLTLEMPPFSWEGIFEPLSLPARGPDDLRVPPEAPVISLVNDVITRRVTKEPGALPLHAALLDRHGRWVTRAWLSDFATRLGGLATTITSAFDVLVLGDDPVDMAQALRRIGALGGGLVVIDGGIETFTLPLELGGVFSKLPWPEVADANRRFNRLMQDRGYKFRDPLFSLLFLTFDSLPWIRLTSRGVWDVRNRKILAPSTRLT